MSKYPYIRGDGVAIAQPLFQEEGSGLIPTSPLQFAFSECPIETAIQLNHLWHSRLPKVSIVRDRLTHCYVAEFDGGFYATAIWTRPVAANRLKDGMRLMELRRLAISPQAPKNTASCMISFMTRDLRKKEPSVIRFISYQDTEVHTGGIYKASGWTAVGESEYQDWTTKTRFRSKPQTTASKIRWEKDA